MLHHHRHTLSREPQNWWPRSRFYGSEPEHLINRAMPRLLVPRAGIALDHISKVTSILFTGNVNLLSNVSRSNCPSASLSSSSYSPVCSDRDTKASLHQNQVWPAGTELTKTAVESAGEAHPCPRIESTLIPKCSQLHFIVASHLAHGDVRQVAALVRVHWAPVEGFPVHIGVVHATYLIDRGRELLVSPVWVASGLGW